MSTSTFWFWVSGLGKTTFIRQFLRSYVENGAPVVQGEHDGSSTSLEQFERDPDSLRIQLGPIPIPGQPLRLTVALQVSEVFFTWPSTLVLHCTLIAVLSSW